MRLLSISLLLSTLFCTGCMYRGRDKIVYIRPDHNSLNRPALHIDKFSHQPPRSRNVDHYRWMYNKGPIDHTLIPELYTHEPITSQTLVPVVAEQSSTKAAQVSDKQWEWLEAETRTANSRQPAQQISHTEAGQSRQSANQSMSLSSSTAQHKANTTPVAKPNWMFSPVVTQ